MKKMKSMVAKQMKQRGYAYVIVLILLLIGSLIITPLLSYMGTGIVTGKMYETKTDELYAADAGIEDGYWNIKYDHLTTTCPGYSQYDYSNPFNYSLNEQVNGENVAVEIRNIWIPKDVSIPSESTARSVVEEGKLIVTGRTVETGIVLPDATRISKYNLKITYYHSTGEDLRIDSIGIWLPAGFLYYSDMLHNSSLEDDTNASYYCVPEPSEWKGGQALIWHYPSGVLFEDFPSVDTNDHPMTMEIAFYLTPPSNHPEWLPDAIGWVATSEVPGIEFSWNADLRIYKITSVAGETTVESYVAKSELRQLQAAIAGDYYATGNSLLSDSDGDRRRETWHNPSTGTVAEANIPNDAQISAAYLYWSGWKNDSSVNTFFSDSCNNLGNWQYGSTWNVAPHDGNPAPSFVSHYSSGTEQSRYLNLKTGIDLNSAGLVQVSWDQCIVGSGGQTQIRYPKSDIARSGTWDKTSNMYTYIDEQGTHDGDTTYLLHGTSSGYALFGFGSQPFSVPAGSTVNSVTITLVARDDTNGTTKMQPAIRVRGTNYRTTSTSTEVTSNYSTISYTYTRNPRTNSAWTVADINGTGSNPLQAFGVNSADSNPRIRLTQVFANVNYTSVAQSDGLDFSISNDNGTTFSSNIVAFRGDIGDSPASFSYALPEAYLQSGFKIRFYLVGNSDVYLDNIRITGMTADNSIVFKINNRQVYLEGGIPRQGAQELTASKVQVVRNYSNGTTPHGYSYSSYCDITALIQTYSTPHDNPGPTPDNYPGYGTYSVGNVYADTNPEDEWSYANWSVIIIYTSQATQGHQLYLYDKFVYSNQDTENGINVDFDSDGQPGGYITGFIVPNPIEGEVNAAKMTAYAGEGDVWYDGDYIAMRRTDGTQLKLWDGTTTSDNSKTNPSNAFNSTSMGIGTYDGIDIDTFGIDPPNGQYVTWSSNILRPGDTSVQVDMVTHTDVWNLVYVILSFRSESTTGGALSYLIKQ